MAASDVNNYFMGLVTGSSQGTLPALYGEINNSHGIKRIQRIRDQDYLDDDCGEVPFRVTNRQAGNLTQCPISASHHILIGGNVNAGTSETRRNKVHRILGGPLPTDKLILHLVAEDLFPSYDHNAAVTGSWTDNSGQGNNLTVTPQVSARPVYRNDSPKEYSNVKFLGDESYFSMEVADDHALASMVNKVVYVVFNADELSGTPTPGNNFIVKTDSTTQSYALTVFAARNVDGDIALKKMTTYDTAVDIKTGSENTGDDFGITADAVATDSLQNEMLAELLIYDFSSGTPHTDDEMKNNMNKLFCKYLVTNPMS
tara:strand:+ start:1271 stop:2215 length:945 start_codon:yes stop_codon:yes gene_type:complete